MTGSGSVPVGGRGGEFLKLTIELCLSNEGPWCSSVLLIENVVHEGAV
jgi:hypothetical protein